MAYRGSYYFVVAVIIIVLVLANILFRVPFGATALSFEYDFSVHGSLERANLLYQNDSFADGDRITLTKMTQQSVGRVSYAQPVRLWDCRTGSVASFSTSFSFAIGGNHNTTRGDGMAFFIGPFPPTLPWNSSAQYLGLYTNPNIMGSPPTVGVEFDTFWNSELDPPLPSGPSDHVGIDINSLHSTSYTMDLQNVSLYGTMSANITYAAASKTMAVSLQLADGSIHRVQTSVDLVAAGLPQDAAIGFSASTGACWESHQLLAWSFNSTDMADVPLTDPSCKTGIRPWISTIVLGAVLILSWVIILRTWNKRRRRQETSSKGGNVPPAASARLPSPRQETTNDNRSNDTMGISLLGGNVQPVATAGSPRELVPSVKNATTAVAAGLASPRQETTNDNRSNDTMGISLPVPREFTFEELCAATNNFSSERLGGGSFGVVYRGDLPGQPAVPVAVKKLLLQSTRKDYASEVMILGQLYHRNLVRLIGWCDSGYPSDRLLLVYELMANGSVDKYFGPKSKRLLTWPERYKIVLGVGFAIEYLHTGCPNKAILHRDIKPGNIMLDDKFEPKLGDFGLVKEMDMDPQQGSLAGTRAGDINYVDPVCDSKDTVNIESDVYSFGVVLLEMATGKKPSPVQDARGRLVSNTLVDAVRESYAKGELLGMADRQLNGDFDKSQMERVLDVGLLCVQDRRKDRPKIRDAVNLLSNLRAVPQGGGGGGS